MELERELDFVVVLKLSACCCWLSPTGLDIPRTFFTLYIILILLSLIILDLNLFHKLITLKLLELRLCTNGLNLLLHILCAWLKSPFKRLKLVWQLSFCFYVVSKYNDETCFVVESRRKKKGLTRSVYIECMNMHACVGKIFFDGNSIAQYLRAPISIHHFEIFN